MDQADGTQEIIEETTKSSEQIWGKLLSLNKIKLNSYELTDKEITIGRNKTCTFCVDDNRLSNVHCKISFDTDNILAKLTDLSTNGTFLGDQKIGKGNEIIIKTGDEIYILHKTKVLDQDVLGFAFFQTNQVEQKSQIVQLPQESDEQIKNNEKMKKLDELGEDFCCPICDDLIFQAVTLMPCLHNFCGSCFSDWMAKQKTCPTCRNDVETVRQNATINNVIEKFLQANPQKKRPSEEYKQMEDNNKINRDTIKFNTTIDPKLQVAPPQLIIKQPIQKRAGRSSQNFQQQGSSSESDDNKTQPKDCLFCKNSIQGFKCAQNQKHVKCEHCKRSFPDRQLNQADNEQLHHKCQICSAVVCNLVNDQCHKKKSIRPRQLFLLKNLPNYGVNVDLFRNNVFEHQVFINYMKKNKLTTKNILDDFIKQYIQTGQFRYVINKRTTSNTNGQADVDLLLSPNTPICDKCGPDVWFHIIFRYRISIKNDLPGEIKNRNVCWWGINCRTMSHNPDHAKSLDHICEQTKT